MSSAPFNPEIVIERLRSTIAEFRQVRGSSDYASITKLMDLQPPEAFVLLARERGKPMPGTTRQPAIVSFGVVIAVRNYKYQKGVPAQADASPLIGRVRDELIGWVPPVDGGRGCSWLQGDVLDYNAGTLLWSEVFQTQHFIGRK